MEIGAVLSRAWQIIWKHKVLWIFGILAGCGSGAANGNNFRYNYNLGEQPAPATPYIQNMPDWQIALIIGIFILIILVLVILFAFLGTIGRIGLVRGTLQAESGSTHLLFSELFNSSLPYFWRVFLLNLIVGLVIGVLFAAIILFGVFGTIVTLGLGLICLIPLICLLVPLGIVVNLVVTQADIAIIVENLGIMDGLRRGWQVFTQNLGNILIMAIILLLLIQGLIGTLIALPLFAVAGPALAGLAVGTEGAVRGGLAVGLLCLCLYLPVLIVLNGILRSYIDSAWTLTYLRLTGRGASQAVAVYPAAQ